MIIQRNTIQIFVFICIQMFFIAIHIQTALASNSEGRGWCCRGGELFQSSPEECERRRGRFFVNRSDAAIVCKPEKTKTEGWCCDGREVFMTVRENCQRRRGHFFRNERKAHRYCEAQKRGWCCKDGKIFMTTLKDCERKRGHFSMEKNEVQAVCKETRIGWCCNKGELYEAHYHDCLNNGGQFLERKSEALKHCEPIPKINSLKPNIFIKGEPMILALRGEKLREGMILDFGPGIIVNSIKFDRLGKKAWVDIFVEPMAEATEREVILFFGDSKKIIDRIIVKATPKTGTGFKEKKVVDIEKPLSQQAKSAMGAKLKKKSPVMLLTGAGGSTNADLLVSVKTTNEIYKGDGKTIYAEVWNNSGVAAKNFDVGFCLLSKINSTLQSKWVGKKKVQFLGQTNVLLIPIPLQTQIPAGFKEQFVVVVDIDNKVVEGEKGEENNQTKPFKYDTGLLSGTLVTGKAVQGLQISSPCYQCKDGVAGKPYEIIFGPTSSLTSDPKALALMSDYARISLLKSDGSKVLTIAENAWFSKTHMTNFWHWLIPSSVSTGKYTIYIESIDGNYFAKSVPFDITAPISIFMKNKDDTAPAEPIMQKAKDTMYKKGSLPPGAKPLAVKFSIKDSKPFVASGGILHQIALYVNIDANQPFTFGEPKGAKASWLILKPSAEVTVSSFVGEKCIYGTKVYNSVTMIEKWFQSWDNNTTEKAKLVLDYPKKVFPKGKSTAMFTLKLKPEPPVEIWEGKKWVDNGYQSDLYNFKYSPSYKIIIRFKALVQSLQYTFHKWVKSEAGKVVGFTNKLNTGEKEIKAGAKVNKNIVIQPSCGK